MANETIELSVKLFLSFRVRATATPEPFFSFSLQTRQRERLFFSRGKINTWRVQTIGAWTVQMPCPKAMIHMPLPTRSIISGDPLLSCALFLAVRRAPSFFFAHSNFKTE
jgi:hypothetical protein